MGLLVYKVADYSFTAEREQYRTICEMLKKYYSNKPELCLFVANYNIYDSEIDGILFKNDAIISVEFKNYGGEILLVGINYLKDTPDHQKHHTCVIEKIIAQDEGRAF